MSYYFKNLKPGQEPDDNSEDDLENILSNRKQHEIGSEESDDELKTLSFASLKKANVVLSEEERMEAKKVSKKPKLAEKKSRYKQSEEVVEDRHTKHFKEGSFDNDSDLSGSDDDSGSDIGFFEEDGVKSSHKDKSNNKRHKHAPTEHSSKKRVSKIREIPGLDTSRGKRNLYQDIRFDKSMGEATDINVIRNRYQFLDEYRQNEIDELDALLHDRKFISKISEYEKADMEEKLRSMMSRMQSIKNRDLERKIVKDYENELNKDNKTRFHLKESDKRKVIQKWKFEHMKNKQREKVMERKRKKRLGKEFKQFEFHQQR
ncbi:hypothetical protein TPHA_0G00540 [Tetrapisispora phaffii CBS 4417]|uniref:rRNA biogenesis protein RRP36 n=1 Tax=Tetrapisispora phaffii (strain ATCC 24235 / CBS 4417 / NBRC 1672 / NRRL Y-8282 / UCD 70-5) TaxID=1071381 RepID=G8BVG2_TETPH|nr:hypothetical protein TPHA_0G00540 [Tetrapisispora phaffii CBS 4417]CCE63890.1 hypothetical protein TPHA_0G00540 [Tetrapisispora phaffii CBS 4417]